MAEEEQAATQQQRRMLLRTSSIDRRKQQLMMLDGSLDGVNREGPLQRELASKVGGFTYRRSDPGPGLKGRGLAKCSSTGTHARGYLTAMSQSSPHSRSWLQDSAAAAGEFLASGPWEDGGQERTSSSGRAERRRPTLAQLQEVEEEESEAQPAVSPRAEGEGGAEAASASPFGQPATRGGPEAAQAEGQRQLDVEQEAEEQEEEEQEEERKEVEEVRPSLGARLSRPSGPSRLQRMTSAADDEVPAPAPGPLLSGVGSSRIEQAAAAALATLDLEHSDQGQGKAGDARGGEGARALRTSASDVSRGNPWAPLPGPSLDWLPAAAAAPSIKTCDSFRMQRLG